MIVTVNGRTIDITLENEKTLGDVLSGMERWLQEAGFSLSGITVDGEAVGVDALETAYVREIAGIERLDIDASTWLELTREALAAAAEALEERAAAAAERIPTIAAAWTSSASASFLAQRDDELRAHIAGALEGRAADIAGAAALVSERIKEIDDPRSELAALSAEFPPLAAALEDLPLALQTGKDAVAAATLGEFANRTAKLFRLVPLLRFRGIRLDEATVEGIDFRSYIEELGAALKELIAAYENGDAVLMGDLAEYELAPRLRSLAAALERALADAA